MSRRFLLYAITCLTIGLLSFGLVYFYLRNYMPFALEVEEEFEDEELELLLDLWEESFEERVFYCKLYGDNAPSYDPAVSAGGLECTMSVSDLDYSWSKALASWQLGRLDSLTLLFRFPFKALQFFLYFLYAKFFLILWHIDCFFGGHYGLRELELIEYSAHDAEVEFT